MCRIALLSKRLLCQPCPDELLCGSGRQQVFGKINKDLSWTGQSGRNMFIITSVKSWSCSPHPVRHQAQHNYAYYASSLSGLNRSLGMHTHTHAHPSCMLMYASCMLNYTIERCYPGETLFQLSVPFISPDLC